MRSYSRCASIGAAMLFILASAVVRAERPVLEVADSVAAAEAEMKPYTDLITGPNIKFDLVPIPGGTYTMGSPDDEASRNEDEGPQHEVRVDPFWMGKHEVTWDEYEIFMFSLDIHRRKVLGEQATANDGFADLVARPTKPYTDMSFGMGKKTFPAISMTQLAAKKYCEWLSAKTGRYYRLPTEAEWEYACRAGTTTAYSFGEDPSQLDEYAWHYANSEDAYHPVGQKKPNPWGLYDMHGNVCEWCVDALDAGYYGQCAGQVVENPLAVPQQLYGRVVRGGSWDDDPELLRSSARRASHADWKMQDPQIPQSMWYLTDAQFVGLRIVRPLVEPSDEEKARYAEDEYQVWEDN